MYYIIATLYIIFLFLLISAFTCIVAIPIYYLVRFLKTKYLSKSNWLTNKKLKLILLILTVVFSSYQTYTAFYPTDSFYVDEFEDNTGLDFPNSAHILTKDASYPDLHGDYSATALIKADKNDFNQILIAIQKDNKFQLDTIPFRFNPVNFDKTIKESSFTKCYTLNRQDRDLVFTISFNGKDNLIEIQRDSW